MKWLTLLLLQTFHVTPIWRGLLAGGSLLWVLTPPAAPFAHGQLLTRSVPSDEHFAAFNAYLGGDFVQQTFCNQSF